jgi:ABC-type uncharacterized transport system permease subunit
MKWFLLVAGGICIALMPILAEPPPGQAYRVNFTDIDGKALSTADGRITTVVLVSKANVDKAHAVGDRIPDFCLGNSAYRMITVVTFETKHTRPVRNFMTSVMRRRVDSRAKQLQARYDQLKIARNARQDIWVVADFDGAIAAQFDSKPDATLFHVFVLGKNGELIKQWNDVPSAEELGDALKQN